MPTLPGDLYDPAAATTNLAQAPGPIQMPVQQLAGPAPMPWDPGQPGPQSPWGSVKRFVPGVGAFQGGPSNPKISPVSMNSTAGHVLQYLPGVPGLLPSQPSEPEIPVNRKYENVPPMTAKELEAYKKADSKVNPNELVTGFTPADAAGGSADSSEAPRTVTTPAHAVDLVDPSDRAGLELAGAQRQEGVGRQMEAETDLGKAAAAKAEIEASGAEKVGQALRDQAGTTMSEADKADAKLAEMRNTVQGLADRAAEMRVDPSHYVSNLGTWDRIRLGIASFFGGFAQGTGASKTNAGLEAIRSGIEDDIASQRAAIESARGHVNDMKGLYAEAYKATGSHAEATAISTGLLVRAVGQQAIADATRAGSPIEIAKAELLNGKVLEYGGEVARDAVKDIIATKRWVPEQTVTTGGGEEAVGPSIDPKQQADLSKRLQELSVPQTFQALDALDARLQTKDPKGIGKIYNAPVIGGAVSAMAGSYDNDISTMRSTLRQAAYGYATLKARGVPSEAAVDAEEKMLFGNGDPKVVRDGVHRLRELMNSEVANVQSGASPDQVKINNILRQERLADQPQAATLPPGFTAAGESGPSPSVPGASPPGAELVPNWTNKKPQKGSGGGKAAKPDRVRFDKLEKAPKL